MLILRAGTIYLLEALNTVLTQLIMPLFMLFGGFSVVELNYPSVHLQNSVFRGHCCSNNRCLSQTFQCAFHTSAQQMTYRTVS